MRRVLPLVFVLGCPASPADDEDATAAPTPTPVEPEVIQWELTSRDGEADSGDEIENVFHAARFRIDTPARIVGVEAMWNVGSEDEDDAHLAIYPDLSDNYFSWDRANPFAEWTPTLDKDEDDEEWIRFDLEEATDAAVSVEFPATAIVVDAGTVSASSSIIVHEDGTVETL